MSNRIKEVKETIKMLTYSEMLEFAEALDSELYRVIDDDAQVDNLSDINPDHVAKALQKVIGE